MADLNFSIRPIELADALYNAVTLSQEHGGKSGCPHVLICYQSAADGRTGKVVVYGVSRLVAGRTTVNLDVQAPGPEEYVSVCIGRDYADRVQSMLRGFGRAKSTTVGVRICEEGYDTVDFEDDEPVVKTVHFSITKDDDVLVELADSDPEREFDRHFDIVDDYLVGSGGQLSGPTAFIFEAVKRVTSLKGLGATALDLAQTTRKHIVAISAGPNFRGILGELDREIYAGPDGARADHLL